MARKTSKAAKAAPKTLTAIEDTTFRAPKAARKPKPITLAEAMAESGETLEDLTAPAADAPKAERAPGTSNLANTIRSHRAGYAVVLHPNGKKTQNNGDLVARALLAVPFLDLRAYSATRFGKSYEHLNDGHARMCIGNLLRGAMRAEDGADVTEWVLSHLPKDEVAE